MADSTYDQTIEERQGETKQALIEILKEMPVIQVACKKVGIGRATYYRWLKEDNGFARLAKEALSEGVEYINDMSESQVIQLIKDKKMPAITLWLKNNSPRYGKKTATRGPDLSLPELTPAEERIFQQALALSAGIEIKRNNYVKRPRPQKLKEDIREPKIAETLSV